MAPEREPEVAVCHAIQVYDRGIICPAEMWFHVVGALTPESAEETLDSLPAEAQIRRRTIFSDRPSLPRDEEFARVVAAIVAWCERAHC